MDNVWLHGTYQHWKLFSQENGDDLCENNEEEAADGNSTQAFNVGSSPKVGVIN